MIYHLSQKFNLLKNGEFNHLTIIQTIIKLAFGTYVKKKQKKT